MSEAVFFHDPVETVAEISRINDDDLREKRCEHWNHAVRIGILEKQKRIVGIGGG